MTTSDSGSGSDGGGGGQGQLTSESHHQPQQQWYSYDHSPRSDTHDQGLSYQPPTIYQHTDPQQPKHDVKEDPLSHHGRPRTPGDVLQVPGHAAGGHHQMLDPIQSQPPLLPEAYSGYPQYQYYTGSYIPPPAPPTYYSLLPEHHQSAATYLAPSQLYTPLQPPGDPYTQYHSFLTPPDYFEEFLQIQGWSADPYHQPRPT